MLKKHPVDGRNSFKEETVLFYDIDGDLSYLRSNFKNDRTNEAITVCFKINHLNNIIYNIKEINFSSQIMSIQPDESSRRIITTHILNKVLKT